MKRIGCILLLLALIFALCGCAKKDMPYTVGRFTKVYHNISNAIVIYKDNETGVEYLRMGSTGPIVIVDQNGKPYIDPEH